jgi:hypothetical protein
VDEPEDAAVVCATRWLNFGRYFVPGTLGRRLNQFVGGHASVPHRATHRVLSVGREKTRHSSPIPTASGGLNDLDLRREVGNDPSQGLGPGLSVSRRGVPDDRPLESDAEITFNPLTDWALRRSLSGWARSVDYRSNGQVGAGCGRDVETVS